MASKIEPIQATVESSSRTEGDSAAQQTRLQSIIPRREAVIDEPDSSPASVVSGDESCASSSASPCSPSDLRDARVSEKQTLQSPFHSPKTSRPDGMNGIVLDDGKDRNGMLENRASIIGRSTCDAKDTAQVTEATDSMEAVTMEAVPEVVQEEAATTETTDIENDGHDDPPSATDIAEDPHDANVSHPANNDPKTVSISEQDVRVDTSHVQNETRATIGSSNMTSGAEDEITVTDGRDTGVSYVEKEQSKRSVPPHLRPDFQSPSTRQNEFQGSKYPLGPINRYADRPRGPPNQHAPNTYQRHRSDGGHEELARMGAQLMKTRNELDFERKKSAGMRKAIEEAKEQAMDAALSDMTMNLVHKQAEMLARAAKVGAKERDLQYRETRIEQVEFYLSVGQKCLDFHRLHEGDRLDMAGVDREHDRHQAELTAKKQIADMEGKVMIRLQDVQLREEALQMREQQYKAIIRGSLEAEMRETAMSDMEARLNEVADIEYNRGFGAGKVAGRHEAEKETQQRGFLEGYSACRRADIALSKVEHGLIPHDSSELEFLYNAAHPQNPFTIGAKIGAMGISNGEKHASNGAHHGQTRVESKPVEEQKKAEEPVRKLPPPRKTLASELRGAQEMHNGHFVLANSAATATSIPRLNNVHGGAEDISHDRDMAKEEKTQEGNLIDLN